MEKELLQDHELRLKGRKELSLTGVKEVESFDENVIVLHTQGGLLIVRGESLHLRGLTADSGMVSIDGRISSMNYEDEGQAVGFLRRLFT